MSKLAGKVAVITGGGSGIGAATAKLFVDEGAQVLIVGRTPEKLKLTVKEIDSDNISFATTDVAKVEDTQRYLAEAVERYGRHRRGGQQRRHRRPRQDNQRPLRRGL